MENPEALAGVDVEAADVAFDVAFALRDGAGGVRGADDDNVFRDDGRGVEPDVAGDEVDFLIVVEPEIHDAVVSEARDGNSRFWRRAQSDGSRCVT